MRRLPALVIDKASMRNVRDAVEAVIADGTPSMLEGDSAPYLSAHAAKDLAFELLHRRGQAAHVRLFTKGPWLHIEPIEPGEGPDAT